jgi:thiamine biosynthesis lipoprotein
MSKPNRNTSLPSRRTFVKALGVAAAGLAFPVRALMAGFPGDSKLHPVRHSTFVMGQIANVTIFHADAAHARESVTAVFNELRRLEKVMSVFDPESELSAVNRAAGRAAIPVSADLRDVIARSTLIASGTRDALDITVNPLLGLWGFRDNARSTPPTDAEVAGALSLVGISGVRIEGDSVGLTKAGASIDLGGVAVGFALDRIAAMLRSRGIASALLELSGDFYAIGAPPESRHGWEIGIEDPRHAGGIWKRVFIRDQALSTSGNYASTVVFNAKSYGHIFDPSRGFPADRLLSATVIAPTAFQADGYSTALFVSGDSSMLPAGARGLLLRS